ncbi:MAG: DNA translocase FtsK 4TM domain-containing protein, partial [Candidatus Deferrimicrobiaceae bacterium]
MADLAKIRRETVAVLFLAAGVVLSVALVSFHQMDPSLSTAGSPEPVVRNWAGWGGAILSDLLLQLFGVGAIGFPVLCLLLAYWTYRGEGILGKWGRAAGGLLAVCSVLGILSFFTGHVSVMGQDLFLPGIVGDLLGKHLLGRLAGSAGGLILLVALLLFSLMLVTGLPLSGLPGLVRKDSSPEKVRERVKEKLAPREAWEEETPRRQATEGLGEVAPPRVVPPRPVPEEAATPRVAGKAFVLPPLDLLEPPRGVEDGVDEETLRENAQALLSKLAEHGIEGLITEIRTGPLVTMYEF